MTARAWVAAVALSAGAVGVAHAWQPNNQYGAVWPGALGWRLNEQGSSSVPDISTVEAILTTSFDTWENQTCTSFSDQYNGRTSVASTSNTDGRSVHGFLQAWPSSYGSARSVIGIASSRLGGFGGQWEIIESDVSFNEAGFLFVQGQPTRGGQADLQSIATHEFGHALGLGHTNASGATMFPSYDNGTGTRTLANDDIAGVCTLYPGSGPPPNPGGGGGTPSGDDEYEENDDFRDAAPVGCGTVIQAIANDIDWFEVTTAQRGEIAVTLTWVGAADLDLYLFDPTQGDPLDASELPQGNSESVAADVGPGSYLIAVNPFDGAADYQLSIACDGEEPVAETDDDAFEDNDDGGSAAGVDCPETIRGIAADDDWFSFRTDGLGDISATLSWEGSADLDLFLVDTTGTLDRSRQASGNEESVSVSDADAGAYAVVVIPAQGRAAYTLRLRCSANAGSDTDGLDGAEGDDDTLELRPQRCGCASGLSPVGGFGIGIAAWALWARRRRSAQV